MAATLLMSLWPALAQARIPMTLPGYTEFCVFNSPDGELNFRSTPSIASPRNILKTFYNGDCGVYVVDNNPARSGQMLRVRIDGQSGWVKSKWLKRASDIAGASDTATKKPIVAAKSSNSSSGSGTLKFDDPSKTPLRQGSLTSVILSSLAKDGYTDASPTLVTEAASDAEFGCKLLNDARSRSDLVARYKASGVYKPEMETVAYWVREAAGRAPTTVIRIRAYVFGLNNYCSPAQYDAISKAIQNSDFN